MISLYFLELAQSELDDIFEAYEYQKADLGHLFIAEVKMTLGLIEAYPEVWPQSAVQIQKCFIRGFPYALLYQRVSNAIAILAVANLRKKPIHWASKSVSEYATCRIPSLPETLYTR